MALHEESLSILDAAACGLPVVVGIHVDASEQKLTPELVYDTGNLRSLIKVLERLEDRSTRMSAGAKLLNYAFSKLNYDVLVEDRLEHFYEPATAKRLRTQRPNDAALSRLPIIETGVL